MPDEIEEHHNELGIKANFNRKPVSIKEMVTVPESPLDYPWENKRWWRKWQWLEGNMSYGRDAHER